jgi:hypothetical protein
MVQFNAAGVTTALHAPATQLRADRSPQSPHHNSRKLQSNERHSSTKSLLANSREFIMRLSRCVTPSSKDTYLRDSQANADTTTRDIKSHQRHSQSACTIRRHTRSSTASTTACQVPLDTGCSTLHADTWQVRACSCNSAHGHSPSYRTRGAVLVLLASSQRLNLQHQQPACRHIKVTVQAPY